MSMKQKKWIRVLIVLAVIAAVIVVIALASGNVETYEDKYKDTDLNQSSGMDESTGYTSYLAGFGDTETLTEEEATPLDLAAFRWARLEEDGSVTLLSEAPEEEEREIKGSPEAHTGMTGDGALYTRSGSFVYWSVDMPHEAMVNLEITYRAPESRGVDLERALYVDDGSLNSEGEAVGLAVPFEGAETLTFFRIWQDGEMAADRRLDSQGNQRRPSQVEDSETWQTVRVKDSMGYVVEPYRIHLQAGENLIGLRAINEPMEIQSIRIVPVLSFRTYEEYVASQPEVETSAAARAWAVTVEGEGLVLDGEGNVTDDYQRRSSSPSLYARYDRSSSATVPYDVYHTVFNYIGGDAWDSAGQWIEWSFDVPEDGWYNITVKARQNHQRGALSCRTLYIDGDVPFAEMATLSFSYDNAWGLYTLKHTTEDGGEENARFYLSAGAHTVRLEATLGEMGPILQDLKDSLDRLNRIYRRILVYTGVNPDRFRDYNLESVYPEVIDAMDLESKRLYKIVDDTVKITGQKSDRVAVAQTLAVQLESFVLHTERITQSFSNFKDNITSLGTAMQNMSETKLDIDQIIISGEDYTLPELNQGFFAGAGHEIRSLVASYTVDYDALGDKYEGDDVLEVWITTGRDQSTVLKSMIDQDFTQKYGVHVNVKLVLADTLLTAVVAGNGPDVVLSVGTWFPVNYAMRNAVEAMDQFDADWIAEHFTQEELAETPVKSYDEVVESYYKSAYELFRYNDHIYALPETQEFSLVFYRTDVLAEYGITVDDLNTWQDLIDLLPTIQGNNMSVGISYPDITNPDMSVLNSLIYQQGGQIYNDAEDKLLSNTKTVIDSEAGVAAFKLYTSLYNDYGLPTVFDFVSRFRTGEMPIGIANYSMYNTLSVSAPEIRGLWNFTYFPATSRPDEEVVNWNTGEVAEDHLDRTVHSQGLCCMIIATDDDTVKKNAWTFLQWWTDTETQVQFGREMESVLGSSARYTTANRDAMRELGWSDEQLEILQGQLEWTRCFPEVVGGYSTTRHMTNAVRRVINNKEDARETLLMYTQTINEEIRTKRIEFNLPNNEEELAEYRASHPKDQAAAEKTAEAETGPGDDGGGDPAEAGSPGESADPSDGQ